MVGHIHSYSYILLFVDLIVPCTMDTMISPGNNTLSDATTTTLSPEWQEELKLAMHRYSHIHGPLALSVCVISLVMNGINIAVLSHKEMISPINRLLQAIGKCKYIHVKKRQFQTVKKVTYLVLLEIFFKSNNNINFAFYRYYF